MSLFLSLSILLSLSPCFFVSFCLPVSFLCLSFSLSLSLSLSPALSLSLSLSLSLEKRESVSSWHHVMVGGSPPLVVQPRNVNPSWMPLIYASMHSCVEVQNPSRNRWLRWRQSMLLGWTNIKTKSSHSIMTCWHSRRHRPMNPSSEDCQSSSPKKASRWNPVGSLILVDPRLVHAVQQCGVTCVPWSPVWI